jgi:hypothetical protein
MAKDLPYFKFFCSEWSDGDITLENYEIQGLFINICSYYWSNNCELELSKLKKRFKNDFNIETLIENNIIKINGNFISISFLDKQLIEREEQSALKSKGGKASAEAKRLLKIKQQVNTSSTENQQVLKSCSTEIQLLRKDKIIEEEIRKENNNDRIFSELIISESWLENTAMQSKQKFIPAEVKRYLKSYNDMINVQFEIKINKTEYCTHFINWLNKQEKKTGIKKPSLL